MSFDNLTVNPGAGGFDRVEIRGTAGPDTVTTNANTVTLGGAVTLVRHRSARHSYVGWERQRRPQLTLAGLAKLVNLGAGNDIADLSGVAVVSCGSDHFTVVMAMTPSLAARTLI